MASAILLGCSTSVVKQGDAVSVVYSIKYANGTVIDTNDPQYATLFPERQFVPLSVIAGSEDTPYAKDLIGMKQGEKKIILLNNTFWEYNSSKRHKISNSIVRPLQVTVIKTNAIDKSSLKNPNNPYLMYTGQNGAIYRYVNSNSTHALYALDKMSAIGIGLEYSLKKESSTTNDYILTAQDGAIYFSGAVPYRASFNNTHLILNLVVDSDKIYSNNNSNYRIYADKLSNAFYVDYNDPLAGKSFEYNIFLQKISSGVQ